MKNFILTIVFLTICVFNVQAQCAGVSFGNTQVGNTVTYTANLPAGYVANNYFWNFGDGNNSNLPSPTHTYANSGWYNICMMVSGINNNLNQAFQCYICDSVYVGNNINPCNGVGYTTIISGNAATFTATVPAGYTINTYSWNFGDGNISNAANPTHTYANAGSYMPCVVLTGLTANNTPFVCTYCDSIWVGAQPAPCNASFTYNQTGNTLNFTSTATGPGVITGYSWAFGDGGISMLQNPTHTYANSGSYTVCQTITGIYNGLSYTCTWCDSIFIANNNPCNGISFTPLISGNTVTYTANVPAGYVVNTYMWNFGDGNNSNLPSPTHTYANSGWYNVCMMVSGINNNLNQPFQCYICDSVYVGVNVNPCNGVGYTTIISGNAATFTATVPAGYTINTYSWNFGDGNTSNAANPTHTYANAGSYSPCVVLTGLTANNTPFICTYCDSITVGFPPMPCIASFTYNVSGNMVYFTSTAVGPGPITSYAWTFGDGNTSTQQNPVHTYAVAGTYTVCLTVSGIANGAAFTCTSCSTIVVGNNINPCNGVSFTPNITGNTAIFTPNIPAGYVVNMYMWNFGDGNNSNQPSPTHTYANAGWYNVCMIVSGYTANNTPFQCSICDSVYVGNVNNNCNIIANFSYNISGLTVAFNNTATCTGCVTMTYYWNFGDGNTSVLPNPTHTYSNAGSYMPCLQVVGIDSNQQTCMDTICKNISVSPSGLLTYQNGTEITLYPNPVQNELIINIPKDATINMSVSDITGSVIYKSKLGSIDKKVKINTSHFATGVYYIQLKIDNEIYREKFVKQ